MSFLVLFRKYWSPAVEIIAPTPGELLRCLKRSYRQELKTDSGSSSTICYLPHPTSLPRRQSNWPPDRTELTSKSENACDVDTTKGDITEWNCVQRLVKETLWTSGVSVTWLGYAWQTPLYLSLQATEIQVARSAMLWLLLYQPTEVWCAFNKGKTLYLLAD
jgi:hypothetical protein